MLTLTMALKPSDWLIKDGGGLYCVPGGFHIDPSRAVDRAVVTHGHGDHARPNNRAVLATAGTIAIMQSRFGDAAGGALQPLSYGETIRLGEVDLRLVPAGHVLGSAQIVLEHAGQRIVVSGDYKRRRDPTAAPFEAVPCDVFVTEATFALPVFRHPDAAGEIARLLDSAALFPERCHVVGAYSLGKCQRVIALLREAGYDRPVYLHGAQRKLCALYVSLGIDLGALRDAAGVPRDELKGAIVLAPPSALSDVWSRRLPDPVTAMASGWMRVRQRARQRNVELPLVISDHADWDELTATLEEVRAGEVWVTHGREDALVYWAGTRGLAARALSLVGRDEEDED
ncbi:MAG: ligase-associated DNA damage response exonuclease [Rhodospirillales bacterium]